LKNTVIGKEKITDVVSKYYNVGAISKCDLIRAGFNHNYLVEAEKGKFVLRVYLNNKYYIRSEKDFYFELELLKYLIEQGLPVAKPVSNCEEKLLITHQFGDQKRSFALFHFAAGTDLRKAKSLDLVKTTDIQKIGVTTALIHNAADKFKSPHYRYHLNLSTYLMDKSLQVLESHLEKFGLGDLSFFSSYAEQLREKVEALPQSNPFYGLIHADLHGENIFYDVEHGITLIDFDHCAFGWRAYEFATWHGIEFGLFKEGFEMIRPLSDMEKELIPTFRILRGIWDCGDILQFQSLWGEDIEEGQLKHYVERLKEFVQ